MPRLVGSDRVLAVLMELARYPDGADLDSLSRSVDSPKPTVHRALSALCRAGLATREGRGRYLLGDEFLRLAFAHHGARPDHVRVGSVLAELADRFGETTHYAVLDGDTVVYRSKVDPSAAPATLTSTVGGRNPAHCTGVGKALLAQVLADDEAVRRWVSSRLLERRTAATLTTPDELVAELAEVRRLGYAVDREENEPGITCLAVPVYLESPDVPSGAISISALAYRTPLRTLVEELPAILGIIGSIATRGRSLL